MSIDSTKPTVAISQTGTDNAVQLAAGSAVVGHVVTDTGSTTAVTQPTAANLNATVVGTGTFAVQAAQTGTWNITNVSGTISLPTGASTAAKQPALGTAGTAASDVITVQGIASRTPQQATATGNVASDGVDSGNPLKVGNLAKSADITAVSDADRVDQIASLLGKQIQLPYATPALTWAYAAVAGGLVSTGGVTAKTAGTGAQRQYITSVQAINSHQTISTEVVIRDGAAGTTLWRGWAQAAGGGCAARFDPPLRGSAATLVEIAEITATTTTGVLMSLQGYTAAE